MKTKLSKPESVGFSTERLSRIKPAMQRYIDAKKLMGINTMVARQGKIVHFDQVGFMDLESKKPMVKDTIFRIYSMTKPIIAAALMILYEEGRFRLFDPVSKFIPAFGSLKVLETTQTGEQKEVPLARPVTIRDLLTHTSGLTYDFLVDTPVGALYREARLLNGAHRSLEQMIQELARLPLAFQPGTKWHYSMGIDVAAYLIEVIANQPLRDFMQEGLFKPLNMIDTDFAVPEHKLDRLMAMYGRPDIAGVEMTAARAVELWQKGFNERIDVSQTYPVDKADVFARGGHGLFGTTQDYMRFAQMMLNQGELEGERILGRKTVELMCMNHLPQALLPMYLGPFPLSGYGFGLGVRVLMNVADSQNLGSVGEFGWSGAANTYYWEDPVEKVVGILMTQNMMGYDLPQQTFQTLVYQALCGD